MKVWSTDEVSPRQTLSYWKDAVCDAFLRIRTEHSDDRHFRGRIASTTIGCLVANDVASQQHLVRRDRHGIARDSDAFFFVNLHKAGACTLSQLGNEHTPAVGDFSFHDGTRPFDLNFHADMALTCFVVPQPILLARTLDPRRAVASPFVHTAAGALFGSYARTLAASAPRLSAEQAIQAGNIFVDLLSLAIGATPAARDAAWPSARRAQFLRICDQIRADLSNPGLSLAAVAARAGTAPRTLQTLFHENGRSFQEFVIGERLQLADRLLSSGAGATVTEIAYAVGFSDLSHFCRSYRRRFGFPPRDRRIGAATNA